MGRFHGALTVVTASLMLSAAAGVAQPGTFALLDYSGAELYQRFCASCHGVSGHGDGPVSGALLAVPDLTQIRNRYGGSFPAEQLRQTIAGGSIANAHGTRDMPVWSYEFWREGAGDGEVGEVIERLISHIRSIQTPP